MRILLILFTSLFISSQCLIAQQNSWVVRDYERSIEKISERKLKSLGLVVEPIFKDLNLYRLEFAESIDQASIRSQLFDKDASVNIYEDFLVKNRATIPNDPDFPAQWGLEQINMPSVWDITTGGTAPNGDDIVVAVFDDGFESIHRDLINNVWTNEGEIPDNGIDDDNNGFVDDYVGWNFSQDNDDHPPRLHGTAVAGIIGASGNNGILGSGVNWNVKLMLTSGGSRAGFPISIIIQAYEYMYDQRRLYNSTGGEQGAYVVASNFSGGAPGLFQEDFPAWCEVYDLLGEEGILNITSAPNEDVNVEINGDLPALCPTEHLILVTNTDRQDNRVQFAGFGPQTIDVGAPGDGIATAGINGELNPNFTGTSAAAPFVAGIAGILYSVLCEEAFEQSISDPESINRLIRNIILSSVVSSPSLEGITTTGGRVDALLAIEAIREMPGLGDCCAISIESVNITDESCDGATDGSVMVQLDTFDIRNGLRFSLNNADFGTESVNGDFTFIPSGSYDLRVSAERDDMCVADTVITLLPSSNLCQFGEFRIVDISPNPPENNNVTLRYELDEAKAVTIVIYDMLGRLVYSDFIPSDGSGMGVADIDISNLSVGIYSVGIRANDRLVAEQMLIAR